MNYEWSFKEVILRVREKESSKDIKPLIKLKPQHERAFGNTYTYNIPHINMYTYVRIERNEVQYGFKETKLFETFGTNGEMESLRFFIFFATNQVTSVI